MSPQRASERAIAAISAARPDVVLVVRGDVLSEAFWQHATSQGRRAAVWMYDEIRRTSFDAALVNRYASIATYSRADAAALRASGTIALHVPLGFDDRGQVGSAHLAGGLVTFIGAPFDKRTAALHSLMSAGLPVKAWGRGWSDHPFDRARTWRPGKCGLPNGRDVSGDEARAIMRASAATLNIHGDQDGFTMRTFEAAGAGAVQLIDRADVGDVYEPGREVLVFEDMEQLVELARQTISRPQDFLKLRERARARTLAQHTFVHRARVLEQMWV